MAKLNVRVRTKDDDTPFTHKKISLGSKSIETPSKALQIGKTQKTQDHVSERARGINEIYFEPTPEAIEKARKNSKASFENKIGRSLRRSKDDEFNLIFSRYQTVQRLDSNNVRHLADTLYSTSDIVVVPSMPNLLEQIRKDNMGTASKFFERYKKNVTAFVNSIRELNGIPIMGTIPAMPSDFTYDLIDLYMNLGVEAFCIDFDGRKVTAQNQISNTVTPLMRELGREGLEEDVFLYALNAHQGRKSQGNNFSSAQDFLGMGFGFDIIGDKHLSPSLPPPVWKKIQQQDDNFRLFQKDDYVYREYLYDELREKIPENTGLDKDRILNRPQDSSKFQALLNTEQQSLEMEKIRTVIDEERLEDHISDRKGVKSIGLLEEMRDAKSKFEGSKKEPSLSNLDDKLGSL